MSDRIEIRGLSARGIIGIHPHERIEPQTVLVDLDLWVDLRPAGRSEDLADSVDYEALAEIVRRRIERGSDRLLERLGRDLCREILEDSRIERVELCLRKPEALGARVASVGIRLDRRRGGAL